jgi:hypothetical protein
MQCVCDPSIFNGLPVELKLLFIKAFFIFRLISRIRRHVELIILIPLNKIVLILI